MTQPVCHWSCFTPNVLRISCLGMLVGLIDLSFLFEGYVDFDSRHPQDWFGATLFPDPPGMLVACAGVNAAVLAVVWSSFQFSAPSLCT